MRPAPRFDDVPPPEPARQRHLAALPAASDARGGPPPPKPRVPWRFIVTLGLIGLAINLALPQVASLRGSMEVLRGMHGGWLALAVAAQAVRYLGQGLTTVSIVRLAGHRLSAARATGMNVAGWTVGLLAGGIVGFAGVTYRWLRDAGVRAEQAVLAGWVPPLLNAAVVGFAALLGSAELLFLGKLSVAESIALGTSLGVLVLAGAALVWAARNPHPAVRAVAGVRCWIARKRGKSRPARPGSAVQRLLRALRAMGRRGRWRLPLAATVLGVAADMASLYFVLLAARTPIGFGVLLAGFGLPTLLSRVAVIPGGVGLVEGTMIGIFVALGVPAPTAVLVVLAYRVLSFWAPNAVGIPLIPVYQAGGGRAQEAS